MPDEMMEFDAGAGDLVGAERRQHRTRALGRTQDAHGDLGDHGKLALAAGQQAQPVVAGGVEMRTADGQDLAIHRDDLQAEKVVGGDAVFQAMRAARVHVDVAADHAGELARRIGRVEEPPALHRIGDADIGDAGLHRGAAIGVVDVEDAVHPHQPDHHRVRHRQRPAGQRCAGAARHHAHALRLAEAASPRRPARSCRAARRPAAAGDRRRARRSRTASAAAALRSPHRRDSSARRPATMASRRARTSGFGSGCRS